VVVALILVGVLGFSLGHSGSSSTNTNTNNTTNVQTPQKSPTSAPTATTARPTATPTTARPTGGNPVTGQHITKIQMGTGWDQNSGAVIGETYTFKAGTDAFVVYTVNSPNANGKVTVKLYNNGALTATAGPDSVSAGINVYSNQLTSVQPGARKIEVYYNNALEASITFTVTA
jgi:hypothetical protein